MMLQIALFGLRLANDFVRLVKLDCEYFVFGTGLCRQKQLQIFVDLLFFHPPQFLFRLYFHFEGLTVPPDEKKRVFGPKFMREWQQEVLSALIVVKEVLVIFFPGNCSNLQRIVLRRVFDRPDHLSN